MTARERLSDDAISRTFEFPAFMDGIAFVQRVAEAAERADHHPDVDIRWRKVTCALSTHDRGGVTELDIDLARKMNRFAGSA